jgi:hypothetical protein
MKKTLGTLVMALSLGAMSTQALAGGPHGHGHGHHPRASSGYHQRSSDWLGPLIVLGIAGAAISAAASQPSTTPPPQVTYVTPPVTYVPPPPPASASYFCSSVGQFYPNTAYCPEGWQLVYPVR